MISSRVSVAETDCQVKTAGLREKQDQGKSGLRESRERRASEKEEFRDSGSQNSRLRQSDSKTQEVRTQL